MEEESPQSMAPPSISREGAASAVFSIPLAWCLLLSLLFLFMVSRLATQEPITRSDFGVEPHFSVDINAAPASELQALPEIGPALAQRIVSYREQVGGFQSLEELESVHGFGPKTLSKLRAMLRVVPSEQPPRMVAAH